MSNIEVGDYVRTVDGFIRKIDNINTVPRDITYYGKYILDIPYKNSQSVAKSKIIKHSENIIDLIEVGDYVNGYLVLDKDFKNEMIYLLMPFNEENQSNYNLVWNTKYYIKSIVTKEQFEKMEYRVDE